MNCLYLIPSVSCIAAQLVESDSYAFVAFEEAKGYQILTGDDVKIFGLCLKVGTCLLCNGHTRGSVCTVQGIRAKHTNLYF